MISNFFHRHKTPEARFAPGLFLALVLICVILTRYQPAAGFSGLGVTLIIAAVLVEVNAARIWANYRKIYKKNKGIRGFWREPKQIYYDLNVWVLWPLVGLLGAACLWVSANGLA